MTSSADGLSNIEAINAQISALNQAQGGSLAGTNGTTLPGTFVLQTQQNFNSMLESLMTPTDSTGQSDSADPFSSLTNDQALQTQIQNLYSSSAGTGNQTLSALSQTSQLLGKQVTYQSPAGGQATGVIAKIQLDQQNNAVVEMSDGQQVPVSAIIGLNQ